MFSRDISHANLRTPRRLSESKFGPYSRLTPKAKDVLRDARDFALCAIGAVGIPIVIGVMLGWRG